MSDMNYFIARMLIEERTREANQQHLAREGRQAQRSEQPSAAPTTAPKARRRSRLWGLVHVRHAHS